MAGRLVVVATPIGNLEDCSPRAATALRDADLVLAEDTRRTATLLRHVGAETPMWQHHAHNEAASTEQVVPRLLRGEVVVLVSDAGTPVVSDPGGRLVASAVAAGVDVEAVPGPSAVLHALVVAGLPAERFAFEGFLPRRGRDREQRLRDVADEPRTTVWFVAPHHAADDLAALAGACGQGRAAALCRELTKLHEEVLRGTLAELSATTAATPPRGELTLVVAGAPPREVDVPDEQGLADRVSALVAEGQRGKDAASDVAAAFGLSRRDVYEAWLRARR